MLYGYMMIDGKVIIDEEQAEKVRRFFECYISGQALKVASENAGLNIFHGSAGRMLRNRHYLGDDHYPEIITEEDFDKAEEIRMARANALGRIKEHKQVQKLKVPVQFYLKPVTMKYSDPFEQAEYIYSLIESEIFENEKGDNELVAHVNADRFVLFWMEENQDAIEERLERVIKKIEEIPERLEIPNLFPVFGIYHTMVLDEIDPLYGNAVLAKHQIKGRRDRHYMFYDELNHESIQENRELEDHFEMALEKEEFEIWYQPKYSAHTRKLVGAEALVRWRRQDGSLIPPLKFIPLFERNGNIIRLDEYVFRAVCRQQKAWQEQGQKMFPVSVNISRVSLYYSNVVEKYESIIRSYDLDSKYIQLEITESATIDNNEIFNLLEQFHTAGFKILLDDFGSGYSSLSTLNRMHFDTIKLDKSLVDYIGDDNGEKLLNSITKLAQSFGMEITAEGVETVEQLMFLCNLDCDDIQGYYFSRPLPVREYEECLKEACM